MSSTVNKKPQARLDLLRHFVYIGERNLPAAERFLVAAEEAFAKLAGMPGMGRRREFRKPAFQDVRSWPIRGFENYLVFYQPTPTGIDILRVIHGAQDIDRILEESPE